MKMNIKEEANIKKENTQQSISEQINCCLEPITKELGFRWRIDRSPNDARLSQPLPSPVFEALSWNWSIETKCKINCSDVYWLYFTLEFVDENGNTIEEFPNEPFFDSNEMCAMVWILSDGGSLLLPPTVLTQEVPLRQLLNGKMGAVNVTRAEEAIRRDQIKNIQIIFNLRVVVGRETKMSIKNSLRMLQNQQQLWKKLFEDGKFSDFTIRTGDGREIRAHRAVIDATSAYFNAMFEMGGVELQSGEVTVPESYAVMNQLIRFLYTGEFPGENMNDETIVEMFVAADKYQISALKEHFEDPINAIFSKNACAELIKAHVRGDEHMKVKVATFIRQHLNQIMGKEGWRYLVCNEPDLVVFVLEEKTSGIYTN